MKYSRIRSDVLFKSSFLSFVKFFQSKQWFEAKQPSNFFVIESVTITVPVAEGHRRTDKCIVQYLIN